MHGAALELDLTRWLVRAGLEARDEAEVLDGLCARLVEAGVPLWRVAAGTELLHPLLDARGCRWRRGAGVVKEDYARDTAEDTAEWTSSPFHWLAHGTEPELRRRLDAGHPRGEFPLLDRFRGEGSTDYVAFAVRYGGGSHFGERCGGCSARSRPTGPADSRRPR
jgi:adenylate cyclase